MMLSARARQRGFFAFYSDITPRADFGLHTLPVVLRVAPRELPSILAERDTFSPR